MVEICRCNLLGDDGDEYGDVPTCQFCPTPLASNGGGCHYVVTTLDGGWEQVQCLWCALKEKEKGIVVVKGLLKEKADAHFNITTAHGFQLFGKQE